MDFRRVSQRVQDDARLDACDALDRIDLEDPVHVLGEVEDDGDVAALAGEAGPRAPGQHRRSMSATDRHGGDHIVRVSWDDEPDRNLTIVGPVGRVECAASRIEPHLASNLALQRTFEIGGRREVIDRFAV